MMFDFVDNLVPATALDVNFLKRKFRSMLNDLASRDTILSMRYKNKAVY